MLALIFGSICVMVRSNIDINFSPAIINNWQVNRKPTLYSFTSGTARFYPMRLYINNSKDIQK